MDLTFLSQADSVTLKLELAKAALETAKNNLEIAKQSYDDLLAQADAHGIPKAKLKKLTEDRVHALLESGILATMGSGETHKLLGEVKRERPRKTTKKSEDGLAPESVQVISKGDNEETILDEPDTAERSHEIRA